MASVPRSVGLAGPARRRVSRGAAAIAQTVQTRASRMEPTLDKPTAADMQTTEVRTILINGGIYNATHKQSSTQPAHDRHYILILVSIYHS